MAVGEVDRSFDSSSPYHCLFEHGLLWKGHRGFVMAQGTVRLVQ